MGKLRIAIITDTKDQIDGIAIGLARLVAAAQRAGHDVSLIGPADLPTAMAASLPFYPQYTWCLPELPALTTLLSRTADLVQVATPGPMGIAGLIAARMLGLPSQRCGPGPASAASHSSPVSRSSTRSVARLARRCIAPMASREPGAAARGVRELRRHVRDRRAVVGVSAREYRGVPRRPRDRASAEFRECHPARRVRGARSGPWQAAIYLGSRHAGSFAATRLRIVRRMLGWFTGRHTYPVLIASTVLGLPPFSLMATAAGMLAVPARRFCLIVGFGRALRFALLIAVTTRA